MYILGAYADWMHSSQRRRWPFGLDAGIRGTSSIETSASSVFLRTTNVSLERLSTPQLQHGQVPAEVAPRLIDLSLVVVTMHSPELFLPGLPSNTSNSHSSSLFPTPVAAGHAVTLPPCTFRILRQRTHTGVRLVMYASANHGFWST